ncbi:MAG: HAD family phosphatase [Succiniclasticum sp.]|jgi:protein cbbY|nr:HAD family phosphatase [Selenomonadales bacterium]MDY2869673.1 HAD family phosphatase [Succiniclasticum sp.]MDY6303341.1 HAD family phosphatase [Succiniclasticum sp.]MDY6345532.1 HAD family phosphatase [Succiniclasticum sp.]
MLKDKRILLFDVDGTLIESVGIWNQVDGELIRRLGGTPGGEAEVQARRDTKLREFASAPDAYLEYCRYLGGFCGSALDPQTIHALRYDIAQDFLVHQVDYKPRAEEALRYLKDKGFRMAIATTTRRRNLDIYGSLNENILAKAPFAEYFYPIYSREDVREIKPNPEVYLKALHYFGAAPAECLVFEDSLIGIEAARRAGMEAVAMYDSYSDGDRAAIVDLATYTFDGYGEFLAAARAELG